MWENNTDGQSLPRVGKVASGASRIGFWWYEKERRRSSQVGDIDERGSVSSAVVYESTLSTAARSPFPNGEGYETRIPLFSHRQSECMHMWKKNNDGQSLPRVGKVASGASRIGFWRYEREGESSQVNDSRKHPLQKQLIKPIYSYKKRKSNAANDFNVICRSGYRYMREKSEAVHFYD